MDGILFTNRPRGSLHVKKGKKEKILPGSELFLGTILSTSLRGMHVQVSHYFIYGQIFLFLGTTRQKRKEVGNNIVSTSRRSSNTITIIPAAMQIYFPNSYFKFQIENKLFLNYYTDMSSFFLLFKKFFIFKEKKIDCGDVPVDGYSNTKIKKYFRQNSFE